MEISFQMILVRVERFIEGVVVPCFVVPIFRFFPNGAEFGIVVSRRLVSQLFHVCKDPCFGIGWNIR